mgnify:FL=1|jgi:hypothetical protein|tara:strand:- start:1611 stop:2255 length:645 start_codon:yes stop_codon:yes gene_type:complete
MEEPLDNEVDSDEERDRLADPVFLPRESWKSDEPMPEVDVRLLHKKTGKARAENVVANDRQRKSMKLQRLHRAEAARALPVNAAQDGRPGGAHKSAMNWTSDEDAELLSILPFNVERPSWSEVTRKLTNLTGNARTLKSVRCRWNRLRVGRRAALASEEDPRRAKNRCRVCGLLKRGHVCQGPSAAPKTANQMLIGVHKDLAALAAEHESENSD